MGKSHGRTPAGYWRAYFSLYEETFQVKHKLCALAVANLVCSSTAHGVPFFQSNATIAARIGSSPSTVKRAIEELVNQGVLDKSTRVMIPGDAKSKRRYLKFLLYADE